MNLKEPLTKEDVMDALRKCETMRETEKNIIKRDFLKDMYRLLLVLSESMEDKENDNEEN